VSASNSNWLYEALTAANVPAELHILKGSSHNISAQLSFPLILDFLDHYFNLDLRH
jgi:dipeptidyl aminopeptidase/acylaminoacyl peptidase